MKKTKVICFSGQKGGVGKSLFSIALTSTQHFFLGKKVLVIDADHPQYSVWSYRNQELSTLKVDEQLQKRFEKQAVPIYPIIKCELTAVPKLINDYKQKGEFDSIIIDTPGTVNTAGYLECLKSTDFIFSPLEAEEISLQSSMEFIKFVIENVVGAENSNVKSFHVFWNKYITKSKSQLFSEIHQLLVQSGISVFKNIVEYSVNYQRSDTRSTLFAPRQSFFESNLVKLTKEMNKVIFKS